MSDEVESEAELSDENPSDEEKLSSSDNMLEESVPEISDFFELDIDALKPKAKIHFDINDFAKSEAEVVDEVESEAEASDDT
jgi:hypothetical protein